MITKENNHFENKGFDGDEGNGELIANENMNGDAIKGKTGKDLNGYTNKYENNFETVELDTKEPAEKYLVISKKQDEKIEKKKDDIKEDHWGIDFTPADYVKWSDMSSTEKAKSVTKNIIKTCLVLVCLYLFICSLGLLSAAFQVLGGKTAGGLFSNDSILGNPLTGLILGILVTVLLQSSSTSTSIIVTMVGAGLLDVEEAVYIIMGTNIGTSVTNTIVSLTQSMEVDQFRLSFAGATVHDMFNLLAVACMLPLEVVSGYLVWLSGITVQSMHIQSSTDESGARFLEVITEPLLDKVVQINKTIIELVSQEIPLEDDASMVKKWCDQGCNCSYYNATINRTCPEDFCTKYGIRLCESPEDFIFANTGMSDPAIGSILLVMSLFVLCSCLILMVKLLNSMMQGSVSIAIKKVINTNFRKPFGWVSGYLAMIVGAILTVLVQSSSVFTSTMTPLVGIGVITIERMYPLTLGSNIGTTTTSIIAALATGDGDLEHAIQLSFCHLYFNITGILIWYPIPFMRKVPIGGAKGLGNTTARYRWFAVFYLIMVFFLIPTTLLALSIIGIWVMGGVLIIVAVILITCGCITFIQKRRPKMLPRKMQTWDFLPLWMHSLQPYDSFFSKYLLCCKCCKGSLENKEDPDEITSDLSSCGRNQSFSSSSEGSFVITQL